jgi:Cu/Ag efflux protein CusF
MKNHVKQGVFVACAGFGAMAVVLAASPARAADPSPSATSTTTTEGMGSGAPSTTTTVHATVVVTSIDKANRKLTFKKANGEKETIAVAPDVKAFDHLKVGDKIDVDYMESVALQMLPPGTKPSASERTARGGDMGMHAGAREVTASAEIISVDAAANKITFKGPRGVRTVEVQDPALQAKLPSLKPGQVVQLTFTEAMAASIQPASK